MVWRREIETKQPKHRCDQSFGLAQRQTEDRPQRQRRRDRQFRVARRAAPRAAGLGLPPRNRRFREPHGQAAALAQGAVIGGPIRHSVALLRDVMTAILVRFEWHGELSAVRDGPPSLQRPPPRRQTTDPCNKAGALAKIRRNPLVALSRIGRLIVEQVQVSTSATKRSISSSAVFNRPPVLHVMILCMGWPSSSVAKDKALD